MRSAVAVLVDAAEGGHGRQRHRLDSELTDRLTGVEPERVRPGVGQFELDLPVERGMDGGRRLVHGEAEPRQRAAPLDAGGKKAGSPIRSRVHASTNAPGSMGKDSPSTMVRSSLNSNNAFIALADSRVSMTTSATAPPPACGTRKSLARVRSMVEGETAFG